LIKNIFGLTNYIKESGTIDKKIKEYPLGVNPILDDSNIVLLQKNYNYLLWSTVTIGLVIISMNVYRKLKE
jgi:hypothetical protein